MVNLYYAKLQNRMPGGLSELAWRLCIYAVRRELFPQNSKADAIIQLDDLISRDKRDRLIGRGECGKPYVKQEVLRAAGTARPWFFNLSHSGEYAICATAHAEIGCDIQRISSERKRLAEQFFHESERHYIEQIPDAPYNGTNPAQEERDRRFTRVWTMRESYAKMTGEGIGIMKDFYIDFSGGVPCVCRRRSARNESADVTFAKTAAFFYQAGIDQGYSCTICCENSAIFGPSIPCFNMTGMIEYN